MASKVYFICTVTEVGKSTKWVVPINPETYSVTNGRNYAEENLIGSRDIPMVGRAKLEHLSFRALLPGRNDPNIVNSGFMGPVATINRVTTWATGAGDELRPLKVSIPGLYAGTMILVSAVTSTEASQEFGDVWIECEFVTWIDPREKPGQNTDIPTISNPYSPVPIPFYPLPLAEPYVVYDLPPRPPIVTDPSYYPARYTVQPGDTVWSIARAHYGDGSWWRRIWESNQATILTGDVNDLTPGEQLILPRR